MQARTSKLRRWRTRSSGDRRLAPPYDPPTKTCPDVVEARRALHGVFRRLTQLFLLVNDPDPQMAHRASGDQKCTTCGREYVLHAEHPHATWLTVLCDGRRVKL